MKNRIVGIFLMALLVFTAQSSIQSPRCTYENGEWCIDGHNKAWWDEYRPGQWEKYGFSEAWTGETNFPDQSEQEYISGFERSVYTSPK